MTDTVIIKTKRNGITREPGKLVKKLFQGTGQVLEKGVQFAKYMAPSDSGRLSGREGGEGGIGWNAEIKGHKVLGEMHATALNPETGQDYAGFIHDGTGIYGDRGQPIKPKNASVLVFEGDDGQLVFAKQVKGQEPQPFLADGLVEAWKDAPAILGQNVDELNRLA